MTFVNHANLQMVWIYVKEFQIDVLERLIVALQRLDELRMRLHQLLRNQGVDHTLQDQPPFCWIGAVMWRSQEDDSIRRDVDRSVAHVSKVHT